MKSNFTLALLLAAPLAAQNDYVHDNGTANEVWGGGNAHTCWIAAYDAIGGSDQITEVLTAFGSPSFAALMMDGAPAQIMVYEDPNDDMNPNDAVLLWSTTTTSSQSSTNNLVSFPVMPPVAVSGVFFIAGVVDHTAIPLWPAPRDITQSSFGRAWICRANGAGSTFNIVNLAANDFPPTDIDLLNGGPSVFRIQANGAEPLGNNYCNPAIANSTGGSGMIGATGSLMAAMNNVTLNATNLPQNQFGFFLNSLTPGFVAMPGTSQGNLCLGGAIGRYNLSIFNSGSTGEGSLVLDLPNTPTPTGPVSVAAGETWNFQCWYRDANPGATSNFTDALEILFQ